MKQGELLQIITERVLDKIHTMEAFSVPIGVSNHHVHLSEADFKALFGESSILHKTADLKQPGQFAAEEVVTLEGPRNQIKNVRILGPYRSVSQVEISLTDSYLLGVPPVVRESGNLTGTPGIKIIGPKGTITLERGVIVAYRHIHMSPDDALRVRVKDGDLVCVKTFGARALIFSNVLVRVSPKFVLEMHIDIDEANAGGIKNNDLGIIDITES